jgi:hypothetical protein
MMKPEKNKQTTMVAKYANQMLLRTVESMLPLESVREERNAF